MSHLIPWAHTCMHVCPAICKRQRRHRLQRARASGAAPLPGRGHGHHPRVDGEGAERPVWHLPLPVAGEHGHKGLDLEAGQLVAEAHARAGAEGHERVGVGLVQGLRPEEAVGLEGLGGLEARRGGVLDGVGAHVREDGAVARAEAHAGHLRVGDHLAGRLDHRRGEPQGLLDHGVEHREGVAHEQVVGEALWPPVPARIELGAEPGQDVWVLTQVPEEGAHRVGRGVVAREDEREHRVLERRVIEDIPGVVPGLHEAGESGAVARLARGGRRRRASTAADVREALAEEGNELAARGHALAKDRAGHLHGQQGREAPEPGGKGADQPVAAVGGKPLVKQECRGHVHGVPRGLLHEREGPLAGAPGLAAVEGEAREFRGVRAELLGAHGACDELPQASVLCGQRHRDGPRTEEGADVVGPVHGEGLVVELGQGLLRLLPEEHRRVLQEEVHREALPVLAVALHDEGARVADEGQHAADEGQTTLVEGAPAREVDRRAEGRQRGEEPGGREKVGSPHPFDTP
mmetsp:Transcript_7980/g.27092  ORF Transcript_7980/g.27092 Transcript_7980/m.27092 type:complete len:520 (-) Transcript_7980:8-1567(-)